MEEKFSVSQYYQYDITISTVIIIRFIAHKHSYTSVKRFHLIFTILVAVVLLSDTMTISIIAIIILMIYLDMIITHPYLLCPIDDCYVFLVFDVAILS